MGIVFPNLTKRYDQNGFELELVAFWTTVDTVTW